jgi:hypothetical protein
MRMSNFEADGRQGRKYHTEITLRGVDMCLCLTLLAKFGAPVVDHNQ